MSVPVLVIGRRGQLASDLAALAGRGGVPVVALGRPEADLLDAGSLAAAIARIGPRAVINAAAYTNVDRAESEGDLAFALNRDGPAALAAACAEALLPLIHVSTDQVFDDSRTRPHREDDAPNPLCLYGRSKLEGERAVAAANSGALIVRVSWVFGPSADNFVKKVLAWAGDRDALSIVADQHGRPTYSPALAAALLDLALRMEGADAPRGILHLAGGSVMTRFDQARSVIEGSGRRGGPTATLAPVATRDFPTPAKRPLNAVLDVSRAKERHGVVLGPFQPDLDETLDAVLGPPRAEAAR